MLIDKSIQRKIIRGDNLHIARAGGNDKIVGKARGYHTIIQILDGFNMVRVIIAVKEGYNPSFPADQLPQELKKRFEKIDQIGYQGKELFFSVSGTNRRQMIDNTNWVLDDVWYFLERNGFVSCCACCGREDGNIEAYINRKKGSMHHLCLECMGNIHYEGNQKRQDDWEKEQHVPANYPMGIFRAGIGLLMGMMLLTLVFYFVYHRFTLWLSVMSVAVATGMMLVMTINGYRKGSHRKPGMSVIVFCTVLSVIFGFTAYHIYMVLYIKSLLDGLGFWDSFRIMMYAAMNNEPKELHSFYMEGIVRNFVSIFAGALICGNALYHQYVLDSWEIVQM